MTHRLSITGIQGREKNHSVYVTVKPTHIEDYIGYNCCLYILMKDNNTYPKFNIKAKYLISEFLNNS